MNTSPEEAVRAFFAAFNRGELDHVMALYESTATLVPEPGVLAEGHTAVRAAFANFMAMKPKLTPDKMSIVRAHDIALSCVHWTLEGTGPDGAALRMEGNSTDVLRRHGDGAWMFAIDNPWGAGILG